MFTTSWINPQSLTSPPHPWWKCLPVPDVFSSLQKVFKISSLVRNFPRVLEKGYLTLDPLLYFLYLYGLKFVPLIMSLLLFLSTL